MNVPAQCSYDRGVTNHRWLRPAIGDLCFCGQVPAMVTPTHSSMMEQVEMNDEGYERLSREAFVRDMEYIFQDWSPEDEGLS